MVCRLGVKKGITGTGQKYDPIAYDLLNVFDVQAGGFRSINLRAIKSITIKGERYVIEQGSEREVKES